MATHDDMNFDALATALEQQRWAAMLKNDATALSALISDAAVYAHSSGFIDDKVSYLDKFRNGIFHYHNAQSEFDKVIPLGSDAFAACGKVKIEATTGGIRKDLDCFFTVVWRKENDAWKLVVHQTLLRPST
ncbi:nuclear transport factor 2 family protein [Burkholderia sp. JP2-270]|uniref:nuclear transport factor 2 family protein n=1 Tax=Burkholderia sp. JP2-270 TaxID=2217913 RepID=UPI0013A6929A|nr:nuclear transport factor 2 family protein [Burkholderia sp. JP2-270]